MNSKKKKVTATITAAALVLALGIAGTFAASGLDESDGGFGEDIDTGMFLHDDFNKTWNGNVLNRDVYVENTGQSSLYVRIRLDEFMKYGGKSLAAGAKQEDKTTWTPHIPAGKDVTDCTAGIHDYFEIQMGNNTGIKYKPGVKNAYDPAITEADKTRTAPAAKAVLIEDYLKATDKPDSCWVLDNKDGYAYWHTQLKKDSATGLILNSITDTGLIDESYFYGINAKAEAVTEMDLNSWFHGTVPTDGDKASNRASENAVRLLKGMSPKYVEITREMKDNGAAAYDSDNDGFLTKKENAQYEAEKGATQTPGPGPTPEQDLEIDASSFPDNKLREKIREKDTNGDGKLSKEERKAVTGLDLSGTGITDYTGLEKLTALTSLNVSGNGLTTIDFLNKTPKLKTLNCSNNHLRRLNVSAVAGITSVNAAGQTVEEAVTSNDGGTTYKSAAGRYQADAAFESWDVTLNADGSVSIANMSDGKTSGYRVPITGGSGNVTGTVTFRK